MKFYIRETTESSEFSLYSKTTIKVNKCRRFEFLFFYNKDRVVFRVPHDGSLENFSVLTVSSEKNTMNSHKHSKRDWHGTKLQWFVFSLADFYVRVRHVRIFSASFVRNHTSSIITKLEEK